MLKPRSFPFKIRFLPQIGIVVALSWTCNVSWALETPPAKPEALVPKPSYEKEERDIPKKPSAPPELTERIPPNLPHCERYFVYGGKKIECDSQLGGDAEMLRPIMRDVPAAIAELDAYQRANKNVRLAAYVGTGGVVSAILGGFVSQPLFDPATGAIKPGGYIVFGGIALAANALIYGLSLLKTNEIHIGNAVRIYNDTFRKSSSSVADRS
ncbi:MAG: hypothetical protein HYX41_01685 [Bdellovibrio sp.]|nr:hypothetical protein [Bdellovibrio sp.]